jgi:hypothetical protein
MLASLARGMRTFFAWSSALAVAGCGVSAWRGEARIMAAEPAMESFLLSYRGEAGALLAFTEALLALLAWSLARRGRVLARLGGGWLVAWAGLWTVNALRWLRAAPDGLSLAISAGLILALACALAALRAPRLALADASA